MRFLGLVLILRVFFPIGWFSKGFHLFTKFVPYVFCIFYCLFDRVHIDLCLLNLN